MRGCQALPCRDRKLPCAPVRPLPVSAGVLFDASQGPLGPVAPTVNLAAPGPRLMPRLWSGILEAITCIDAGQVLQRGMFAWQP